MRMPEYNNKTVEKKKREKKLRTRKTSTVGFVYFKSSQPSAAFPHGCFTLVLSTLCFFVFISLRFNPWKCLFFNFYLFQHRAPWLLLGLTNIFRLKRKKKISGFPALFGWASIGPKKERSWMRRFKTLIVGPWRTNGWSKARGIFFFFFLLLEFIGAHKDARFFFFFFLNSVLFPLCCIILYNFLKILFWFKPTKKTTTFFFLKSWMYMQEDGSGWLENADIVRNEIFSLARRENEVSTKCSGAALAAAALGKKREWIRWRLWLGVGGAVGGQRNSRRKLSGSQVCRQNSCR